MATDTALNEADIIQAIKLLDARIAAGAERGPLLGLRARLIGEMIGDADRIDPTLTKEFELVTHVDGASTVTDRAGVLAGIRGLGQAGALMWVELDDVAIDGNLLAAHGVLMTVLSAPAAQAQGVADLGPDDLCRMASQLALFVRFDGDLMAAETLYMNGAAPKITVLRDTALPTHQRLLELAAEPK